MENSRNKVREFRGEVEVDSVFTNSMDSLECLQIFDSLQNAEKNVTKMYEMKEKTQSTQIKRELQLNKLNEAVEFITKKFDEYEAEKKENEKIINDFLGKVSAMSNELMLSRNPLAQQQQYSKQKCVLIHQISEQKGYDKDVQTLKIIRERETV